MAIDGGQLTQVNGNYYSFQSIKIEVDGQLFERCVGVSYEHSLDPEELRGVGPKPIDVSTGVYKASGELSMYLGDWRDFRSMLADMPGLETAGYMQKVFNVTVSYADDGEEIMTDVLRTCRVRSVGRAYRSGNQPLTVDVKLYVMEILEESLEAVSFQGFDDLIANLATGAIR